MGELIQLNNGLWSFEINGHSYTFIADSYSEAISYAEQIRYDINSF